MKWQALGKYQKELSLEALLKPCVARVVQLRLLRDARLPARALEVILNVRVSPEAPLIIAKEVSWCGVSLRQLSG